MKNRDKDAIPILNIKTFWKKYFFCFILKMKKLCLLNTTFSFLSQFEAALLQGCSGYFFRYITSFTSFTVRGTSGSAAATRLGA
jgi:hypothetical protein